MAVKKNIFLKQMTPLQRQEFFIKNKLSFKGDIPYFTNISRHFLSSLYHDIKMPTCIDIKPFELNDVETVLHRQMQQNPLRWGLAIESDIYDIDIGQIYGEETKNIKDFLEYKYKFQRAIVNDKDIIFNNNILKMYPHRGYNNPQYRGFALIFHMIEKICMQNVADFDLKSRIYRPEIVNIMYETFPSLVRPELFGMSPVIADPKDEHKFREITTQDQPTLFDIIRFLDLEKYSKSHPDSQQYRSFIQLHYNYFGR